MFAIFKKGSKQFRVEVGSFVDVDLIDAEAGSHVEFDQVLCLGNEGKITQMGAPFVKGCSIKAKLVDTVYDKKKIGMKYTPRQRNYRKFGHRQRYSRVEITDIKTKG